MDEFKLVPMEPTEAVQGEPVSRVVPARDDLIQCLLATYGQSEDITADAILSMLAARRATGGEEMTTNKPKPEGL